MKIDTTKELKAALKEASQTGRNLYFQNEPTIWLRVIRVSATTPAKSNVAVIHFASENIPKGTVLLGGTDPAQFDIR